MLQTRLYLVFTILFAYAWRLHGLTEESLWRDEVDAVYFALRDLPATLSMFVSSAQNGALYFLSLRPWLQLVGSSEFALRYPSVLAGVICVPLVWKVAQKLLTSQSATQSTLGSSDRFLNHLAPLGAAALLAVNPYQLWYSQEGKMYTIIVALALLASWLWLRGIETGQQRICWRFWLGYLVVATISIYSHLLMILLLPVHALWFLIIWPKQRRAWWGYGAALAGLTLPYLPMLWWQWDMLMAKEQKTLYTFTPFQDVLQVLLNNHTQGFMAAREALWYAPLYFVALAGLLMGAWELRSGQSAPTDTEGSCFGENDTEETISREETFNKPVIIPGWKRYLMLLGWLFLPILLIHGLSLRQPIFVDRYIIWIGPAGIILLMLGLAVVWHNAARIAKPLVFCLLIYICGFWFYAGWEQKALDIKYNLRSAVGTITSYREASDLLILQIPHMERSYRYYSSNLDHAPFDGSTERLGHWAGGLWTNNGHPDEQARAEVAQQMESITAGFDTVWVLRSEAESWDLRHLMDEWLDNNSEQVDYWDYHGSQVRRYRLGVMD